LNSILLSEEEKKGDKVADEANGWYERLEKINLIDSIFAPFKFKSILM
jgi:hypothetical protein